MSFLDDFRGKAQRDQSAADAGHAASAAGRGGKVAREGEAPLSISPQGNTLTLNLNPDMGYAADSSIISEAAPSDMATDFAETASAFPRPKVASPGRGLPLIGTRPLVQQQRILATTAALGLFALVVGIVLALGTADRSASQVVATGEALMQSQRLAKSVSQALVGQAAAFTEVKESAEILAHQMRGMKSGDGDIPALPVLMQGAIDPLLPLVERAEKNAGVVLAQQKPLTQLSQALQGIKQKTTELQELAEGIVALKLQQEVPALEVAAASHLTMLTQRIGRNANEALSLEGMSPQAALQLGKDLIAFGNQANALLAGNPELRIAAARDGAGREQLIRLIQLHEQTREQAGIVLGNPQGLAAARAAQASIVADSEALRSGLQALQARLGGIGGASTAVLALMALGTLALLLGGVGLLRLYVRDQAQRAQQAERQRVEAERQERDAKRVNDANQAAILRLMNELQTVAEGDLTQQATVTEDITGAIADSVNYTVEELRSLVSQVQDTVGRVTETTQQVETTSTELLAASTEQLREIRETGESVLQMAGRINDVSAQAQQTAEVARHSLSAAETGLTAVQDTIDGMNSIRDQIQDTSKRIKRLGESSQEIGEITELISDITEQTNVLALNAAIQAASAGDAGRGFSVVAEEVQRLAERSADATRQIAALVKTIQTDTQDAVGAMERSTQGVVEGTRLSDAAGAALVDIDRVTRQLSELIGQISTQALEEAASANLVATNIQHIFAVTEQTGEGTRSTAHMVRDLSRAAEELKQSVARFKIN